MVFKRSGFNRVVTLPLETMLEEVDSPKELRREYRKENESKCCEELRGQKSRLARLQWRDAHQNPRSFGLRGGG